MKTIIRKFHEENGMINVVSNVLLEIKVSNPSKDSVHFPSPHSHKFVIDQSCTSVQFGTFHFIQR